MTLFELAREFDDVHVHADEDVFINAITHDSRCVQKGDLFVALPGERYDGRTFIPKAIEAGAAALAVPVETELVEGMPTLTLDHPRRNLAELCARFYGDPSRALQMVGVTGTNGKTTVASILAEMMSAQGLNPGTIGTLGYQTGRRHRPGAFTTPEAPELHRTLADMVNAHVQVVAVEVSSVGLTEERVHGIEFNVAAFLNLTPDHLDYHGTMANYGAAKRRLFSEHLAQDAVVVINIDDPFGSPLADELKAQHPTVSVVTVSVSDDAADYAYEALSSTVKGVRGVLRCPSGQRLTIQSSLLGEYHASNIAVACAIAQQLQFDSSAITQGASEAVVRGRLERVMIGAEFDVFVDYAHTADALYRTLETLKNFKAGRLWCVFGCGGDRDKEKRPAMGRAAAMADVVIVTNDNPRTESPVGIAHAVIDGCRDAGLIEGALPAEGHVCVLLDRTEAIKSALAGAQPGDIILIAGKGHETYQEVHGVRHPFDDVAVAQRCWSELAS